MSNINPIKVECYTDHQRYLLNILWDIDTQEGLDWFIQQQTPGDQLLCLSLIELVKLATMDHVEDTRLALKVLSKYQLK